MDTDKKEICLSCPLPDCTGHKKSKQCILYRKGRCTDCRIIPCSRLNKQCVYFKPEMAYCQTKCPLPICTPKRCYKDRKGRCKDCRNLHCNKAIRKTKQCFKHQTQREQTRKWYIKNRDKILPVRAQKKREAYAKQKDSLNRKRRERYKTDEDFRQRRREYNKKYYQTHSAEIKEMNRQWREKNKQQISQKSQKYYQKNKAYLKAKRKLRYQQEKR